MKKCHPGLSLYGTQLSIGILLCYAEYTYRVGLGGEQSIFKAHNRCCFARELYSEVFDLSRLNVASADYSFLMFYLSRASDNIIFSKGGAPRVQNCMSVDCRIRRRK